MGVCIDTELVDLWCDVSSGGDGGGGIFFQTRDEFGGRRLEHKNEAFCR